MQNVGAPCWRFGYMAFAAMCSRFPRIARAANSALLSAAVGGIAELAAPRTSEACSAGSVARPRSDGQAARAATGRRASTGVPRCSPHTSSTCCLVRQRHGCHPPALRPCSRLRGRASPRCRACCSSGTAHPSGPSGVAARADTYTPSPQPAAPGTVATWGGRLYRHVRTCQGRRVLYVRAKCTSLGRAVPAACLYPRSAMVRGGRLPAHAELLRDRGQGLRREAVLRAAGMSPTLTLTRSPRACCRQRPALLACTGFACTRPALPCSGTASP